MVHQIGLPADLDRFQTLAAQHGLKIVEDAACAIGSKYHGRQIGSEAETACFSFHPRKVITTGEGGMITTSRADFAERLRLLRQHGMSLSDTARHSARKVVIESYDCLGYNYRMTDIQAAIGVEQMKRLEGIVSRRRRVGSQIYAGARPPSVVETPACSGRDRTEFPELRGAIGAEMRRSRGIS